MEKALKLVILVLCLGVSGFFVTDLTTKKLDRLSDEMQLYDKDVVTAKERERQLECLAINIYREAGNEPFEGKVGVAQVTLNRVEHPAFPKDVCAVVYEKNKFYEKVVCQFSWYCDGAHRSRPIHKAHYAESYEVAKKVLLEGFRLPSLEKALFYHADYINPGWPHERIAKLGTHIFYEPRKNRNV